MKLESVGVELHGLDSVQSIMKLKFIFIMPKPEPTCCDSNHTMPYAEEEDDLSGADGLSDISTSYAEKEVSSPLANVTARFECALTHRRSLP